MSQGKTSDLNLRHLNHLIAVCDNGYSISRTASKLRVAQSMVSRNIQSLEEYFGGKLFIRKGKRIVGPTPLCQEMIHSMRNVRDHADGLSVIAERVLNLPVSGKIRIACTHLQARYVLPKVMGEVQKEHPNVGISISQGFPADINDLLMSHSVDLGVCSEVLGDSRSMVSTEAYSWERILIAPHGHPVLAMKKLTLPLLAKEQIVTYVTGITGRMQFDEAFVAKGLHPNVKVAAADSDVIKEFTRLGHGIGVISEIAYDPQKDADLGYRCLDRLFKPMATRIVHRKDRLLSNAERLFIEVFCEVSKTLATNCHNKIS